MGPVSQAQAVAIINVAVRVLSERALTFAGMSVSAVLFGWVMYAPDPWRLGAAAAFAVLVFLPLVRHEAARAKAEGGVE